MAVSLKKGGLIHLTREAPNLKRCLVGLGWDERVSEGEEFDLDAVAFLLTAQGRVRADHDFVYFNHHRSLCLSVELMGDNRTGASDDEVIQVQLERLPYDIQRVVFGCAIHEGDARGQHFGLVNRAFIRLANLDSKQDIARYDLGLQAARATAFVLAELIRENGGFAFKAVGEGVPGGLPALCARFGIEVKHGG